MDHLRSGSIVDKTTGVHAGSCSCSLDYVVCCIFPFLDDYRQFLPGSSHNHAWNAKQKLSCAAIIVQFIIIGWVIIETVIHFYIAEKEWPSPARPK